MVDYADSSQLNLWQFDSPETLARCRAVANRKARELLFQRSLQEISNSNSNSNSNSSIVQDGTPNASAAAAAAAAMPTPLSRTSQQQPIASFPVEHFACGVSSSLGEADPSCLSEEQDEGQQQVPLSSSPKGHPYLSPDEEQVLVSFYVSKLPSLVGPGAPIVRCRRESKVAATAALLTRRFFLSNSVMAFDPKAIMVAAAFLAAKVEDATIDVRYLEEGTTYMNAPVTKDEIIPAEISLLAGTHFDLLCFHPLKCVLAVTEDLRTYLKSDQGQGLVSSSENDGGVPAAAVVVSGQDLKPTYDAARALLDDAIVSDLPLLFNPGHVGLAALIVGQEVVQEGAGKSGGEGSTAPPERVPPRVDFEGYIRQRFVDGGDVEAMLETLRTICKMLRELKLGKWGCGNHSDLSALKSIHKKLKKVRAWGHKESPTKANTSKKRDLTKLSSGDANTAAVDDDNATERPSKKPRTGNKKGMKFPPLL
jgi:cyclin H